MLDRGFFLTRQAIGRQLAAMPHSIYLIRLIHSATRRAFPGERLWTAAQLTSAATIRFLRLRNREGCDVYIYPYAGDRNAGYILLDLDAAHPTVLEAMRRHGLEPCVVVQTSPGHLQAWLHVSRRPLDPALATIVARQVAGTYGGDLASADWCHLGRLAGFTNQKPTRRTLNGDSPWVIVRRARAGLASRAEDLLQSVTRLATPAPRTPTPIDHDCPAHPITPHQAIQIYHYWMRRGHVPERFSQPDWSIVDLWVARALLSQGSSGARHSATGQSAVSSPPRKPPGLPAPHAYPRGFFLCRATRACVRHAGHQTHWLRNPSYRCERRRWAVDAASAAETASIQDNRVRFSSFSALPDAARCWLCSSRICNCPMPRCGCSAKETKNAFCPCHRRFSRSSKNICVWKGPSPTRTPCSFP